MKKDEQKIKRFLLQNHIPEIDSTKKEESIQFLTAQFLQRDFVIKKSFLQSFFEIVSYISPLTWLLQFIICLVFFLFPFIKNIYQTTLFAMFAPLVTAIAFTEIVKTYFYEMWELEQSCKYNLKQILIRKLLLFGIVDFCVLLICLLIYQSAGENIWYIALFLFVPYHLSNSFYLLLLKKFRHQNTFFPLLTTGLLFAILFSVLAEYLKPARFLWLLKPSFSIFCIFSTFIIMLVLFYHFLQNYSQLENLLFQE